MKRFIFLNSIAVLWTILICFVAGANKANTTTLMVGNPYRASLKLEVKCDWVHEKQQYRFYRIINVPKKTNITIVTPQNMRFCEIWPLDFKLL